MRLELSIGGRYLMAKRRVSFVSIITFFCIIGIVTGVTVLITVLSVMNGFQNEVRDKILGTRAHINITGNRMEGLRNFPMIISYTENRDDVTFASAYVDTPAILRTDYLNSLISVRGVEPRMFVEDKAVSNYFKNESGSFAFEKSNYVLIGSEMSSELGLTINDKFVLITSIGRIEKGDMRASSTEVIVKGIYKTGYYEYDSKLVLTRLDLAQSMTGLGSNVSGVAIKLKDYFKADRVAFEIDQELMGMYFVTPWMLFDRNFFSALHNEKLMLGIVLSFIILIASLNIATSQIIFVKDKRREIAILKTMGLKPLNVALVFFLEGAIIGLLGTVAGVCSGVFLATHVNEALAVIHAIMQGFVTGVFFLPSLVFEISIPSVPEFFPESVYYLDKLPSIIETPQVVLIAIVSFGLTVIFAVIPAYTASRLRPTEVLRYE